MTVAVLGDLNVDLEIELPSRGGAHANPDPVLRGGGSAANTAVELSRLGIATRFVGTVGDDAYGRQAMDLIERSGVDVSTVRSVDDATVMVVVVLAAGGERLVYVWPPRGGAHLAMREGQARRGVDGAEWVHVSGIALRGEPAAPSILAAMSAARSAGATVSLDLNLRLENWGWEHGFRASVEAAITHSDVVLGSFADEIVPLTGSSDATEALAGLAADSRIVIARLGRKGAVAHDGRRLYESAGFEVEAVDTVGAGDAFNAGFIAARCRGAEMSDALEYANAAAALTVAALGAQSGPSPDAVASLISTRYST